MKLLIISDIHGNLPALGAVMKAMSKVDKIICLGDIVGYFPYTNEVIEAISSFDNLICVLGNHDHALLSDSASTGSKSADMAIALYRKDITRKNKRFLMELPQSVECVLDGLNMFIFHGSPANPINGREPFWENDYLGTGIYFFGHSHKPFYMRNSVKKRIVVNPGSCGFPRDGDPRPSYALVDTAVPKVDYYRVEYCMETVVERCKEYGLPGSFWKSLVAGAWVSSKDSGG